MGMGKVLDFQFTTEETEMVDLSNIQDHAEVIGADGVHVGTVDHVDGRRLKLTRNDSSDGRHHYIDIGLIADIEDGKVRLSANGDVAVTLEEEGLPISMHERVRKDLEDTFANEDPKPKT
jgi:hypothetical protein